MSNNPYRVFAYGKKKRPKKVKHEQCVCAECREWLDGKRIHGCFFSHKSKAGKGKSKAKTNPFHKSGRWLNLRQKIIDKYGRRCMCCQAEGDDIQMHVDHIKPKAKHPDLAYDEDNLQVLCRKCNFSKNTLHETDYRNLDNQRR